MSGKAVIAGIAAIAAVAIAVVLIAGNGDGDDRTSDAERTDDDFIAQMTVHHESAIEMAEMAQERSQRPEIQRLADAIVSSQSAEIDRMASTHERLFDRGVEGHEHGDLGLSAEESGMEHDMAALETAPPKQFDQVFIDSMVPHHQGAIRMARIVLDQGDDEEVAALASAIIEAQSREIEQMNQWRQAWYGAPSPAGGVPAEGETEAPSHEAMGH